MWYWCSWEIGIHVTGHMNKIPKSFFYIRFLVAMDLLCKLYFSTYLQERSHQMNVMNIHVRVEYYFKICLFDTVDKICGLFLLLFF